MWPTSSTFGPTATFERADHEVAQLRFVALGLVRPSLDRPSVLAHPRLAEIGDLVHTVGRVRPAVDVDHLLELGDERVVPGSGEVPQTPGCPCG